MSEALVAELGRRVDMDVPVSILRELGSQEYQAKLLEAQAKVAPVPCKCFQSQRLDQGKARCMSKL